MSDTEEDEIQIRTVKITIVGEPGTGKSSLCARYLGSEGSGGAGSTMGAEVIAGQAAALRPPAPLQLVDVAGAALHTDMLPNYLYDSDIVLFVYDLTNLQSFDKLHLWLDKVNSIFATERKPIMALFGNKSDLEHHRAIRFSCVQKLASENLLESFLVSARTGDKVTTAFTKLIARVLGRSVRYLPASTNGRSPLARHSETNGHNPMPMQAEPTQSLIMNRKALRKLQRKASSTVCCVQ